ncbi:DUF3054 domain-containing protein [Nocardioides bruguierae]|uniref:DUF3054 domain-containing protein n=1 Tax=Nocardioides bruguierae TaxID=2945102 RepID=UPI002022675F|nr:DUF3054 domain-containing protein [Nocardioides bruguierae]MCL8027199.1 DUF3054 domain-containing protein [Nocardioides bruguierae]
MNRWLVILVDLVFVLFFAAAGRESHESGSALALVLVIAWPFVVALAAGHALVALRRWSPAPVWPSGVTVLAVTYLLGMSLRFVQGRGLAPGFLVVSLIFLTVTLLGWRASIAFVERRTAAQEASEKSGARS